MLKHKKMSRRFVRFKRGYGWCEYLFADVEATSCIVYVMRNVCLR